LKAGVQFTKHPFQCNIFFKVFGFNPNRDAEGILHLHQTGGWKPPSLARWKRAATVEAGILPASERGFQPRDPFNLVPVYRCTRLFRSFQTRLDKADGWA
jgi:hypothetical protein